MRVVRQFLHQHLGLLTWCNTPLLTIVLLVGLLQHWEAQRPLAVLSSLCPVVPERVMLPHSSVVSLAKEASNQHGLDYRLILSVIAAESRCNLAAHSHAGAKGLMQLMPRTATWLGVPDIGSPRENINGGTKYLAMLLEQFNGDIELALAAYNAGPRPVKKHRAVPPYRETRQFVQRVMSFYQLFGGQPAPVSEA